MCDLYPDNQRLFSSTLKYRGSNNWETVIPTIYECPKQYGHYEPRAALTMRVCSVDHATSYVPARALAA